MLSLTGYRRTALVIVNANGQDQLRFDVEGLPLAFKTLSETCVVPPSPDNLKWVLRILQNISRWTKENLLAMLDYALKWKSINLWEDSTKSSLCSLQNVGVNILLEACRVFSFESARLRQVNTHGSFICVIVILTAYLPQPRINTCTVLIEQRSGENYHGTNAPSKC